MTEQIRKWITTHNMIQTGDLVVVGLSGGEDSVCLLYILKELADELGISAAALHVHHGIRGAEADEDAAFCAKLCEKSGILCRIAYVDVPAVAAAEKQSLEEAARAERYRELESYRQELGAQRIAVAHHRDDNAETVLWNLFRGSGLKGLSGMEAVNGYVIRPLLGTDKADIRQYLKERGIPWRWTARTRAMIIRAIGSGAIFCPMQGRRLTVGRRSISVRRRRWRDRQMRICGSRHRDGSGNMQGIRRRPDTLRRKQRSWQTASQVVVRRNAAVITA